MISISISVLCEDIRSEINNKFSLMGVYGGDILINAAPPAQIDIALYLELENIPSGENSYYLRIEGPNIDIRADSQMNNVTGESKGIIATPKLSLLIEGPGSFTFSAGVDGDNLTPFLQKKIIFSESSPTSPQQLSSQSLPVDPAV